MPTIPKDGYVGHDGVQTLQKHPTLPLIIYRGSFSDKYTLWRVVGPGKLRKVSTFSSAFPKGRGRIGRGRIEINADGRFLYEKTTDQNGTVRVAVFAFDATARVKRTVPVQTFGHGGEDWVFADVPAK